MLGEWRQVLVQVLYRSVRLNLFHDLFLDSYHSECNVESSSLELMTNKLFVYCKKYKDMSAIEIILIGVVILLIFGGKKLPELMRGIGKSVKEFKDAKDEPPVK
jgi:sec-independent protein translocase protein TatA